MLLIMKTFFISIFYMTFFLSSFVNASQLVHKYLSEDDQKSEAFVWEQLDLENFNELLISWEAHRPEMGFYQIDVSVLTNGWSPWLNYAFWSASDQHTFDQSMPPIKTYQDTIEVDNDFNATGIRIRVTAHEGALLSDFRALHACASDLKQQKVDSFFQGNDTIVLDVQGLSQMALDDARNQRLCSPTSTTAVIRFLTQSELSPITFANGVWDSAFDIYGNWVLNTAQASYYLGPSWHCCVARLTNFQQLIDSLENDFPVVVSIKGPLAGAPLPYKAGHLLVVCGYDALEKKVLCMDPAYADDHSTLVSYALDDFLAAWNRRKGLAYIFWADIL